MLKIIKTKISFQTKIKIQYYLLLLNNNTKPIFKFNHKKKRIYIFLAADYGNLGDVAITYAQRKFLANTFKQHQIIEIPISNTIQGIIEVKKNLKKNDIVTIVGGGNMGDMYSQIEHFRQLVIKKFPNNKIISFPQTIDFSDTVIGRKLLKKAQNIYNRHKDLIIIARESKSYEIMKNEFPNSKLYLLPDIVMTLDIANSTIEREGVTVCLRDDKEKKLTNIEQNQLVNLLKVKFDNYNEYDTHVGGNGLSLKNKVNELFKIWEKFKKSELVVTDRLHGMIFCHITNTPALVFLNNNHKILLSFEWIKENKNIRLVKDFSITEINQIIEEVKSQKESINRSPKLISEYEKFISEVKKK